MHFNPFRFILDFLVLLWPTPDNFTPQERPLGQLRVKGKFNRFRSWQGNNFRIQECAEVFVHKRLKCCVDRKIGIEVHLLPAGKGGRLTFLIHSKQRMYSIKNDMRSQLTKLKRVISAVWIKICLDLLLPVTGTYYTLKFSSHWRMVRWNMQWRFATRGPKLRVYQGF